MYSKNNDAPEDTPAYPARGSHLVDIGDASTAASHAWRRIQTRLKAEFGEDVYSSWFARIELVGANDAVAHLSVPTRFLKSWISSHYRERLCRLFREAECGIDDVQIVVRVAGQKAAAMRASVSAASAPQPEARTGGASPSAKPHSRLLLLTLDPA